jgi:hypothetical protein
MMQIVISTDQMTGWALNTITDLVVSFGIAMGLSTVYLHYSTGWSNGLLNGQIMMDTTNTYHLVLYASYMWNPSGYAILIYDRLSSQFQNQV